MFDRKSPRLPRYLLIVAVAVGGCRGTAWPWASWSGASAAGSAGAEIELPHREIGRLQALARQAGSSDAMTRERVSRELGAEIRAADDPLIRRQIVRTLGSYRTDTSGAVLRAALQDSDPDVRLSASRALARHGDAAAVDALAGAVENHDDVDVRLAAASALSGFRDPRAMTALAAALDDRDPALQYRAIQSLREVTGQDLGTDLEAWRRLASAASPAPQGPSAESKLPVARQGSAPRF